MQCAESPKILCQILQLRRILRDWEQARRCRPNQKAHFCDRHHIASAVCGANAMPSIVNFTFDGSSCKLSPALAGLFFAPLNFLPRRRQQKIRNAVRSPSALQRQAGRARARPVMRATGEPRQAAVKADLFLRVGHLGLLTSSRRCPHMTTSATAVKRMTPTMRPNVTTLQTCECPASSEDPTSPHHQIAAT
jgi:hypothetical protein